MEPQEVANIYSTSVFFLGGGWFEGKDLEAGC